MTGAGEKENLTVGAVWAVTVAGGSRVALGEARWLEQREEYPAGETKRGEKDEEEGHWQSGRKWS